MRLYSSEKLIIISVIKTLLEKPNNFSNTANSLVLEPKIFCGTLKPLPPPLRDIDYTRAITVQRSLVGTVAGTIAKRRKGPEAFKMKINGAFPTLSSFPDYSRANAYSKVTVTRIVFAFFVLHWLFLAKTFQLWMGSLYTASNLNLTFDLKYWLRTRK